MHITPAWCEEQFGTLLRFAADLHSHPELSFEETRTTKKFYRPCKACPAWRVLATGAKTGAVARFAGGEGPAVALRADIDAIPQHEAVQRPDASVYEGQNARLRARHPPRPCWARPWRCAAGKAPCAAMCTLCFSPRKRRFPAKNTW